MVQLSNNTNFDPFKPAREDTFTNAYLRGLRSGLAVGMACYMTDILFGEKPGSSMVSAGSIGFCLGAFASYREKLGLATGSVRSGFSIPVAMATYGTLSVVHQYLFHQ